MCQKTSFSGEAHDWCQSRYGLDGLASVWEYEGVVKRLLNMVKYQGITHAAADAAEKAFHVMTRDQERFASFLEFLLSPGVSLAFVPMELRQEKRRGQNHAQEFAKRISRIIGKEDPVPLLEKPKKIASQAELSKEERLRNVKNAFAFTKKGGSTGKAFPRLVLVDDVWTTGATMRECCRVLKKAGAREVWGFTIARTS
ncbi:MAG: phosphoribosyltransferase family protein [bacterium]|nr:phosphoribosyltransferase family protein [bacterium]